MWLPSRTCNLVQRFLTHIFVRGLIGGDEICMEAGESDDGPDGEKTHNRF